MTNESPPTTTPTLPPIATQSTVSSMSHTHFGTTWSPKGHFPLLPIATDSHAHSREGFTRKVSWKRRHSDLEGGARSLSHFQHLKGIIESHRNNTLVARQPHVSPRPPNLPSGLPPELSQYISEIWKKHIGQQ